MKPLTKELLTESYHFAKGQNIGFLDELSTRTLSEHYTPCPSWAIGPFQKKEEMTFHMPKQWRDPTGIEWSAGFIFNPSLIEKDGALYLVYRATPKKETYAGRIGMAVYTPENGWRDYENNPIIYPTADNESYGCEDPKLYRVNDRYFLFYQSSWPTQGSEEFELYASQDYLASFTGSDINLAVSDDLMHWEKKGTIMDYSVSRLWSKGAVIPRDPAGNAVKIDGRYVMFLSDGLGAQQHVGYSDDMINWTFEKRKYLDISQYGHLYEVSCAVIDHDNEKKDMVLDFYYRNKDGKNAAGQMLYDRSDIYKQIEFHEGGTLAWGGLIKYHGEWLFAQGWDAKNGDRDMFFYYAD